MKTKTQIIHETVDFYSKNTSERRAIEIDKKHQDSSCQYLTKNGKKCAVGRCISDKILTLSFAKNNRNTSVRAINISKPTAMVM